MKALLEKAEESLLRFYPNDNRALQAAINCRAAQSKEAQREALLKASYFLGAVLEVEAARLKDEIAIATGIRRIIG